MRHAILLPALLLLVPAALRAQEAEHAHAAPSPYTDLQGREIKALSPEEIRSLLAGEGMGFALAAELNGWPGPKHVLELADSLQLSADQRTRTEAVMADMLAAARPLGARIVAAERTLDAAFVQGKITASTLRAATLELGRLRGELRGVHLAAHLAVTALLTEHQIHRYQTLRGYGAGHGDE